MRRIKQGHINFISLVPRGANKLPVLYKSEDNSLTLDTLVKADMEEGTITAVVYAPESRDSQGDIASAEVIKDMAHRFQRDGGNIDIRHDGKKVEKEDAFIAETFIIGKGDERFKDWKDYSGEPVDVTGGWGVVLKIESEELRKAYRDGEWNGVSMGGSAVVEAEKEDSKIISMLKSLLGRNQEGDSDMKPEDLDKALEKQATTITEGFASVLKEAGLLKPISKEGDSTDTGDNTPPQFTGDISKEDDRRAHRKKLAIWKAEKDHANDPVALFDRMEKIEEEFSEGTTELDKAAGVTPADSAEIAGLKRQLHKAQSRSNQDTRDPESNPEITPGFSKEDAELAKEAVASVRKEHYGETD